MGKHHSQMTDDEVRKYLDSEKARALLVVRRNARRYLRSTEYKQELGSLKC